MGHEVPVTVGSPIQRGRGREAGAIPPCFLGFTEPPTMTIYPSNE